MNVATILAAGQGKRFGMDVPKQFVEVLEKPILAYTLETFQNSPEIDAIQIVCQPEYKDRIIAIVRNYRIDKIRWITEGGSTRPESFRNAVLALRQSLNDDDIIVVHVGVSPLVSPEDIASSIAMCAEKGCCFTMHPIRICMAQSGNDGWTDRDAPKEKYIELNASWSFRYADVFKLYQRLTAEGRVLTDADSTLSLWLADGRKAWYVRGSEAGRMKITTPHDRDLFEGYLLLRVRRGDTHEGVSRCD